MSQWSGQGMGNYEKRLNKAREIGDVSVNRHMRRPTEPTCLLGYKGKRPNNKTLELTAEKLRLAAQTRPDLQAAADNAARLLGIARAEDQAKEAAKKPTEAPKAKVKQTEETQLKAMIEQLKAAEAPKPQPPPLPKAQAATKTFDSDALRKKIKAEHMKRLAQDLKVPQYDAKWIDNTKLGNKAG